MLGVGPFSLCSPPCRLAPAVPWRRETLLTPRPPASPRSAAAKKGKLEWWSSTGWASTGTNAGSTGTLTTVAAKEAAKQDAQDAAAGAKNAAGTAGAATQAAGGGAAGAAAGAGGAAA